MDGRRFDDLTRALAVPRSRRGLGRMLLAVLGGGGTGVFRLRSADAGSCYYGVPGTGNTTTKSCSTDAECNPGGGNCCRCDPNQQLCVGTCSGCMACYVDQTDCGLKNQCGDTCRSCYVCNAAAGVCQPKACGPCEECKPPQGFATPCDKGTCESRCQEGERCVGGECCLEARVCLAGLHCCPNGDCCGGDCLDEGETCCQHKTRCPAGRECCGATCLEKGATCCAGKTPCPKGRTCCGTVCLETDQQCCGHVPCPKTNTCCPDFQVCTADGCCDEGNVAGGGCCPFLVCENGECCGPAQNCCAYQGESREHCCDLT